MDGAIIKCPPNGRCNVNCHANRACYGSTIISNPTTTSLSVVGSGNRVFANSNIQCPQNINNGDCAIAVAGDYRYMLSCINIYAEDSFNDFLIACDFVTGVNANCYPQNQCHPKMYCNSNYSASCDMEMVTDNAISDWQCSFSEAGNECYVFPSPTINPTRFPLLVPSDNPTVDPSVNPSFYPTFQPISTPSNNPTISPSCIPTYAPTSNPTVSPSTNPTTTPSESPSSRPTLMPTIMPTPFPTHRSSIHPSTNPSHAPTMTPTNFPSIHPSIAPTRSLTSFPSPFPTDTRTSHRPTKQPSAIPSNYTSTGSPTTIIKVSPQPTLSTSTAVDDIKTTHLQS